MKKCGNHLLLTSIIRFLPLLYEKLCTSIRFFTLCCGRIRSKSKSARGCYKKNSVNQKAFFTLCCGAVWMPIQIGLMAVMGKTNRNRGFTDWTMAVLISAVLNIVLFGLMPALTRMAPHKNNIHNSAFKPLKVAMVNSRQMPLQKKEITKNTSAVHDKIRFKRVIKVFKQQKMVLKPALSFDTNHEILLNSALNSDFSGPESMPVMNFTMSGPVLKGQYMMGELDTPLIPIVKIPPKYPAVAMRNNIEGWVKVRFIVTDRGVVKNIRIIKAVPGKIFNSSVIKCVSKWRFRPGKVSGVPVNTIAQTIIRFKLES